MLLIAAFIQRKSKTVHLNAGAKGTAIRNRLDGRWVKTIVFTRPMRRAGHAAPRWEQAFRMCTAKKTRPKVSRKNRAVSLAKILLLSLSKNACPIASNWRD